jgi:hypothetical protein
MRRPTRQLFVSVALATALLGTLMAAQQYTLSLRTRSGGLLIAVLFGALNAVMLGCVTLAAARYEHIRLDPYGIVIARTLRPKVAIPWARVSSITTESHLTGRYVALYDGPRRIKLPVPVDHWTMPNLQFEAQAAHIVAWWEQSRKLPPPH